MSFYHNLVEIRRGAALIYRDNTRYDPRLFDMAGVGMYEGYTHLLNLFLTAPDIRTLFPGSQGLSL